MIDWRRATASAVVFAVACLIKESGVMLPALGLSFALLWRRPPVELSASTLHSEVRRWWRVVVAFAIALAVVVALRVMVLGSVVPATIAAPGLAELTAAQRVWAMLSLGPVAAHVLLIPQTLNPHYGPSYLVGADVPTLRAFITIAVVVVSIAFAAMKARRGDGRLGAGIAWLLLAFLPASNLFSATGQIFAERTLYVSTVGLALIVAWAADRIVDAMHRRRAPRALRLAGSALAAIVLVVALGRTLVASTVWRTHTALFRQMIAADARSYRGYWLVGLDERSRGQTDSALVNLSHAQALYSRDRQLLIDYAETLRSTGRHREAARIAAQLMEWPELRRNADAVKLYLDELALGFGSDSVRAARQRLGLAR
jgi:hypothetical protein